jgi:hypothetical protein
VSLLAGAAALLVAFVAIQRRVREPMLPLGLFRRTSFTGVQLAAFTVSGSLLAMFLYLTLYLQNYLGYSPLEAGLRYLPITLLAFLVGPIAGALLSRVPARALLSAGLGMTGVGLLNPVIADVAVSVVPTRRSGMAAGISDTFRQVGIAVGIAVWGAILVGRGADKVAELLAGTPTADGARPRELMEAASSGNLDQALAAVPPQAQQIVSNAVGAGFLEGLNAVLTLAALLSFAGALLALWLVREHEIRRQPMAPERELKPESDALPEAADA